MISEAEAESDEDSNQKLTPRSRPPAGSYTLTYDGGEDDDDFLEDCEQLDKEEMESSGHGDDKTSSMEDKEGDGHDDEVGEEEDNDDLTPPPPLPVQAGVGTDAGADGLIDIAQLIHSQSSNI